MKIVILRPSYKPEHSAGNHLASDLADDLIKIGHEVIVIVPSVLKKTIDIPDYGYQVKRVKSIFRKKNTISRILWYLSTSIKMFFKLIFMKNLDLIFTHSMPPTIGFLSVIAGKVKKVPVVYWEQDIVSESIISTKITKNRVLTRLYYKISLLIERNTLKRCTHIITISEKFKNYHLNKGFDEKKITVIHNWIDTNIVYPIDRVDNFLFEKFNLNRDIFYVTYCGNMGVPQNLEIMIDAAEKLISIENIHFIIIGNGSREEEIMKYIKTKKINNFSVFPLQPLENSKEVYSIGDIGLVIAKSGTSNNGFPSKTWSILAAGQSIITCFDLDSELSIYIQESKSGISIEPDSSEELKNAILEIYNDRDKLDLYRKNAREFVQNFFSRKMMTNKLIAILEKYKKRGL